MQVSGRAVSLGGMKLQVLLVDISRIHIPSEPGSDRLGPTELGNLFFFYHLLLLPSEILSSDSYIWSYRWL